MDTERLLRTISATLVEGTADWATLTADEWQQLPSLADIHGVLGLLQAAFTREGWPATAPPAVRSEIELRTYLQRAQSLLVYGQLPAILDALRAADPLVLLKGVVLGTTRYPDPALRPLSDVDLLVVPEQVSVAREALARLGFAEPPVADRDIAALTGHHISLQGGPGGKVVVEVHWRLVGGEADWRSPTTNWFWQQIEPWQGRLSLPNAYGADAPAPSRQLFQLDPTAHLLYLAAHLMLQHGAAQARLVWLYDLHLLLTHDRERIAWDALVTQAQQFRWATALEAALRITHAYFGSPVPHAVLATLAASQDAVARTYVRHKAIVDAQSIAAEWLKLQALAPPARLQHLCSVLFPSPAHIRWRYRPRPAWIWPLCYPYRWLRIVARTVQMLATLVGQRFRA